VKREFQPERERGLFGFDGTVAFASALEAIGMESMVFYLPGHAIVGVRAAPAGEANWKYWLALETTALGSTADFTTALNAGINAVKKSAADKTLTTIEIKDARAKNWLPAPYPL
jgi:hypothetical protein